MHIERENPSVLAKVTPVNDVAHGPLVWNETAQFVLSKHKRIHL
jgi:hypothetical protein